MHLQNAKNSKIQNRRYPGNSRFSRINCVIRFPAKCFKVTQNLDILVMFAELFYSLIVVIVSYRYFLQGYIKYLNAL